MHKSNTKQGLRVAGWLLLMCILLAAPAWAQDLRGRRVSDVLDELHAAGLTFIYNTQILPNDLRIEAEPRAREGVELAREILAVRGLALSPIAPGAFAVVRAAARSEPDGAARLEPPQRIEEIVVQASRYRFATGDVSAHLFLTQE